MIGEKGIYDELNEVGIKCHGIEDNNVTDIASLGQLDPAITSVVVGLDTHVNYVKLSRARRTSATATASTWRRTPMRATSGKRSHRGRGRFF